MSNNEENALLGKVNFEKLKSLREKVNWEIEEERGKFFKELSSLVKNWKGPYPDLGKIFRPEEIDWILSEDVRNLDRVGLTLDRVGIMSFVINCGYRDQPVLDKDGKPSLRRTTPLHVAGRLSLTYVLSVYLAGIYDRFDANYVDDVGCTHFHVVCTHGYANYAERFLELGQDPNLLLESTGESPLHMALKWGHNDVAMLLLKKGANANLANRDGITPLHLISDRDFYYENDDNTFFKEFFKFIKDKQQAIQIEAKDKWGRTPLQWAVTSFMPDLVDACFDLGADPSNFVFPTERQLDERFMFLFDDYVDEFKLRLVAGALAVLECLKRRGYELERSDALKVMKFFLEYKVFRKLEDHEKEFVVEDSVDLKKCWYDEEEFTSKAQKIMINPSLSLYQLVRLRPGEAEKRLAYEDCFEFARSDDFLSMPDHARENDTCNAHLNEILASRFCRRWALDPFMEMTRHRLPILCCEMILENLKNEDLCRVCFAATDHDISSINKKKVIVMKLK